MIDLARAIQADIEALTSGTAFTTREGTSRDIACHLLALPDADDADGAAPMCLVLPRVNGLQPSKTATVDLRFLLYCPDRATAITQVDTLVGLLAPLGQRGRGYAPWKLGTTTITQGDPADGGLHPHPVYLVTVTMEFSGGPAGLSCN